jgi:hypothetical protein
MRNRPGFARHQRRLLARLDKPKGSRAAEETNDWVQEDARANQLYRVGGDHAVHAAAYALQKRMTDLIAVYYNEKYDLRAPRPSNAPATRTRGLAKEIHCSSNSR